MGFRITKYTTHFGLEGLKLQIAVGVVAGTAFWLFGYDMGVMGSVVTEDSFLSTFPQMQDPAILGIAIASFELGCLAGALSCLFIGDPLGRRLTVTCGMMCIAVGGAMQAGSSGFPVFCIGRIIAGIGMGIDVATVPSWQAEVSRATRRGQLVMIEGAMCTIGVASSSWIGYAFWFTTGAAQWRPPIALQCLPALIVWVGINFLPESPRWLVKHGRVEDASFVLSKLFGKPETDPEVKDELDEIIASFEAQSAGHKFAFRQLFEGGKTQAFRRVLLGFFIQAAQQISGINLVTTYANKIINDSFGFSDAGVSHMLAACINTEYALCSFLSFLFIERVGRRKMFMITAAGMGCCFFIVAGLLSTGGKTDAIVAMAFLFLYQSFFGLVWVGGPFLYSAEIIPYVKALYSADLRLRLRAEGNAIASSGNWIFCFMVVMIVPVSFANIGNRTYIYFGIFCACFVPIVYFFLPETQGRTLEVFASGGNPVKVEKAMPRHAKGEHVDIQEVRRILGLRDDVPSTEQKSRVMEKDEYNVSA